MTSRSFRWLLLKRSLLQKKTKAFLIILAVTMGASVVAALLNLQTDLRHRMNRELRDYGPNVLLVPKSEATNPYISEALIRKVESGDVTSIVRSTPEVILAVQANNQPAVLVGARMEILRQLYPGWDWKVPDAMDSQGAILGIRLAHRLEVKAGSAVEIKAGTRTMQLPVSGFVESGEEEDDRIFVDLHRAQSFEGSGRAQVVAVSVLGDIDSVSQDLSTLLVNYPEATFRVIRKIAAAETLILERISRLMALVISFIFVILFFCIQTTVSAILISRSQEIALCRVLGARRNQIMVGLSLELLILGFLGGISGFCLGMIMAQILGKVLFQAFIVPHFHIFLITIFSSLAMMIISSFRPISRAVNRQAALALKEI